MYQQWHGSRSKLRQDQSVADNREQLEKVAELMGEGSARWIRLIVLSLLILSGVALQVLVCWYAFQSTSEEWVFLEMQSWAFVGGAWVVILGLLLALLWRCMKDMLEGGAAP